VGRHARGWECHGRRYRGRRVSLLIGLLSCSGAFGSISQQPDAVPAGGVLTDHKLLLLHILSLHGFRINTTPQSKFVPIIQEDPSVIPLLSLRVL
jgi:hypothetical protein